MIRNTFKYTLILVFAALVVTSCSSRKSGREQLYNPNEVEQLAKKLKIELSNKSKEDHENMRLYSEVSLWLGVPYRYAGNTKKGVDCSGFTYQVFEQAYAMKIPRSTAELDKMKKRKISKGKLQTGDLVFFATGKKKKNVNHVGIYLKDGNFIHASTSRGVMVSHLDEDYYKRAWKYAARMR